MKYLIDTHALIWFCLGDRRLSSHATEMIASPQNRPLISVATTFEMAIKSALGKLKLPAPVDQFVSEFVWSSGGETLGIAPAHCAAMEKLPLVHKDPFDRMLVAQALVESVPLLSGDPILSKYGIRLIW